MTITAASSNLVVTSYRRYGISSTPNFSATSALTTCRYCLVRLEHLRIAACAPETLIGVMGTLSGRELGEYLRQVLDVPLQVEPLRHPLATGLAEPKT